MIANRFFMNTNKKLLFFVIFIETEDFYSWNLAFGPFFLKFGLKELFSFPRLVRLVLSSYTQGIKQLSTYNTIQYVDKICIAPW